MTEPRISEQARRSLTPENDWIIVVGLIAMLIWTTLSLGGYLARTMVMTSWAVFALAAFGAVSCAKNTWNKPLKVNLAAFLPLPFLLYALASCQWIAPAKWLAWHEWLLWFQMWLVFVLALHFGRGSGPTKVIVLTLAALGLTGVALAAYQRWMDPTWMMLERKQASQFLGRSSGMFGIPNSLAGLLELLVPVSLTLLVSRRTTRWMKIACALLAALFIFAMMLTGSRGGWIALGVVLVMWPLLGARHWRFKTGGALLILLVVGGGGAVLFHLSENIKERIQPFLTGQVEASRPVLWKVGVKLWHDHPVAGGGAGSYNVLFERYRPRGFLDEPMWTHNEYLNTLSDYGVVGFFLWFGAALWLLWLGWGAVRHARARPSRELFSSRSWRLGLFLGILAYALHLGVDFHTKLPALAFAFSMVLALLLRDESMIQLKLNVRWLAIPSAALLLGVAWSFAGPHYRGEALRYEARCSIDRHASTGKGDLGGIVRGAKIDFERATALDPCNSQAWADLSYAITQNWREGNDLIATGREAEAAAEQALRLCPVNANYWIRKGVALDMQARPVVAETCFRQALDLAPNTANVWYYHAYHLSAIPVRRTEAMQALETCLALDPANAAAVTLREKLLVRPQ